MEVSEVVSSVGGRLQMFRRKGTAKEKKITDDYMRMLEERGRRILELDSEC